MTAPRKARIALDRRTAEAVVRGHPWVYGDQLPKDHRLRPGDEVDLHDPKGAFVGRALADPTSPIPLRVWTRDEGAPPLRDALFPRIAAARRLRERTLDLGRITGFRQVHGEGDDLPGLVVDRYGAVLVVRVYFSAWEPLIPRIVEALLAKAGGEIEAIVRSERDPAAEGGEGGAARVLWGEAPEEVEIREGDRIYPVTPGRGQKTGFFLDQRPNRDAVEALARPGDRCLNLYSFTGGFSVAMARAGAAEVTSVDVAEGALTTAREAFRRSGLDPEPHAFVPRDAFAFLEQAVQEKRRWDVVVSDPPAFAHAKEQLPRARLAYLRLHRLLGKVVAPGGLLITASCTARWTEEDHADATRIGLAATGRTFRLVARGGAGADHPIPLGFPEGRYLKVLYGVVE